MSVRIASEEDKKQWNDHVRHPLQSWEWGTFRESMGIPALRLINGQWQEAWQLTFHRLGTLPFTVGYFPKGPLPSAGMIGALKKEAGRFNAISIQLEPDVSKTSAGAKTVQSGLLPSHRPLFTRYTFVLNLTKPEDALLAAMHPKTRYNIRVAERHGVRVSEDNSEKAFSDYLALHTETTNRQRFYAHNETYMKNMWRIMHNAGIARLFTATHEHHTLAAWIIFTWKGTIYYPYGASSRHNRNVMAPNLMLWEIAKWGIRNKYRSFDLWGALGPDPDPADPWYGFHKFKQGFTPDLIEFAGSYDLILKNGLYKLFTLADRVRWSYLLTKKRLSG